MKMKFFKDNLGISDIEKRVIDLENRMNDHESAIRAIAESIRTHTKTILAMTGRLQTLIDSIEEKSSSQNKVVMSKLGDDTYN